MTEADRKWLERQGELKKQSLLWEQWPPERIAFFKAYWSVALKWYIPFAVMLLFLMYAGCGEPNLWGFAGTVKCEGWPF